MELLESITIQRCTDGSFLLVTESGSCFYADTLENVAYGLQHCFESDLFDNRFDRREHLEHAKICNCCPICQHSLRNMVEVEPFSDHLWKLYQSEPTYENMTRWLKHRAWVKFNDIENR